MSSSLFVLGLGIGEDSDDALFASGLEAGVMETPVASGWTAAADDDLVTVSIFTKYPDLGHVADISIDPRVTAVSYESQIGGWGRARIGLLPDGYSNPAVALEDPAEVPEDAHVVIRLGGSVVYEGVAVRVAPNRTGFECEGYGLWAMRFGAVEGAGTLSVTSGVIVREAIRAVPWLRAGEIVDPGVYHDWSEVRHRKPGVVVDQMASEGDGNTPWMLYTYEDNLFHFTPKVPKDMPDIVLSYDPETMQVGHEYNRIDGVRIAYRDVDGTERIWPPSGQVFTRAGIVPGGTYQKVELLTGTASSNGAVATAMTYLAKHSQIGLSGTAAFANLDYLNVRYGDTFQLRGYGESDGRGIVERVSVDLMGRSVQMVLGEPSPMSAGGFLNALAASVAAGHNKVDPVTKARAA